MTGCPEQYAQRVTVRRLILNALAFTLLLLAASTLAARPVLAQGPPQLTVDARTYRPLLQARPTLTAAACQPFDTLCAANAAHTPALPLFKWPTSIATNALGEVYVADAGTGEIVKLAPSGGSATVLAGDRSTPGLGFPAATGLAVKLGLTHPNGIAVDLGGNLYIADSNEQNGFGFGSLIKVDALGIATRLTATYALNPADPAFLDGAQSTTQLLNPTAVATDTSGNAYVVDASTCTVRKYVPSTGILTVVAGTLASGCGSSGVPSSAQLAKNFSFASIAGVAVGSDQTVYLTDATYGKLFSVTPDGKLHVLAGSGNKLVAAGASAGAGDIGEPYKGLAVDGSGGVYFASLDYASIGYALIEVTKGTSTSPSQVIELSGALSIVDGITDASDLTGAPAKLSSLNGGAGIGLDPFGRLLIASADDDNIAYLDRNGTAILDPAASTETILTYTNTGASTLTGVAFGGTGHPYSFSPTNAQITEAGESGATPFSIHSGLGTCPANFAAGLSLAPGASCTLALDYTPNPHVPGVGALTLYTNDPAGPQTVVLSTAPVAASVNGAPPQFSLSAITLTPSASTSRTSTFTVKTTVASATSDGETTSPVAPTGTVVLGLSYVTTGATVQYQQGTPDPDGNTTFTFTNIPSGNYTMSAQAVYEGDSGSQPAFSPVQALYVSHTNPIDFTEYSSIDPRIPYQGATPQFLNLFAQAYTIPAPAFIEDLYAGNVSFGFTLSAPGVTAISPASTSILPVGNYKVTPLLANASALDYGTTTHPGGFYIDPADLTVSSMPTSATYGQYLTPSATSDLTHFSLNSRWSVGTSATIAGPDLVSGAIKLVSTIQSPPFDPTTHLLLPGNYTILPTLSGSGIGNYSLTAISAILNVGKADLTLNGKSFSTTTTTTLHATSFCDSCYTAPNASLLTGDSTLTVQVKLTGPGGATATYPLYAPTGFTLAHGTWTSTFLVSGAGAANYTQTLHSGTIIVQ